MAATHIVVVVLEHVEVQQDTVAVVCIVVVEGDIAADAADTAEAVYTVEVVELCSSQVDVEAVVQWDVGTGIEDHHVFVDTSAMCQ